MEKRLSNELPLSPSGSITLDDQNQADDDAHSRITVIETSHRPSLSPTGDPVNNSAAVIENRERRAWVNFAADEHVMLTFYIFRHIVLDAFVAMYYHRAVQLFRATTQRPISVPSQLGAVRQLMMRTTSLSQLTNYATGFTRIRR